MTELFPLRGRRIYVAGHTGMAGGAIVRRLGAEGCSIVSASKSELDLTRQRDVEEWMAEQKPDAVFVAAARVGGILANSRRPAEFIYENLAIETNLIHAAYRTKVKKLLFLGSSCIFPRDAEQPMVEESLLTGPLEPTNEAYAIAKIAGMKLCQAYRKQYGCDFVSAMPTNLYGFGDRYDLLEGHVAAAIIMKVFAAKAQGLPTIEIWGTGTPKREFLFSEDLADGCVFMMKHYSDLPFLNLGTGVEISIRELAEAVAEIGGWRGEFVYNGERPDGTPRKVMNVSKLTALGWTAKTSLRDGLRLAYENYVAQQAK